MVDKNNKCVCPSCSSQSVFLSEYRGMEGIITVFLPCNIYRCLDCNNRYWAYQPFFANPSRMWGLVSVTFLMLVLGFLFFQPDISQDHLSRKAEYISTFETDDNEEAFRQVGKMSSEPVTAALSDSNIDVEEPSVEPLVKLSKSKREVIGAKQQSEKINSVSKANIERLEFAVVEDEQALVSLLKVDINYAIESWRKAWQSGDVDSYLSSYGENFTPDKGVDYQTWKSQRRARVSSSKKIELLLSEFDVSFKKQNQEVVVTFTQAYSSPTYSDISRKKLVLENQQSSWKIISEQQITE